MKRRARAGAFEFAGWLAFASALAEGLAGARVEIAYRTHDRRHPVIRLHEGGFRAALAPEPAYGGFGVPLGRPFAQTRLDPRHGPGRGIALVLHREAWGDWLLRVWFVPEGDRARRTDGFSALLARLGPTLARCFDVSLTLAHGEVPALPALERIWDRLPHGAFLVERDLRPVFSNAAAEDLRTDRALFRPVRAGQPLMPASPHLRDELEHAAHRVGEGLARRQTLHVPGRRGEADLLIHVADPRFARMPLFYARSPAGPARFLTVRVERCEVAALPAVHGPGAPSRVLPWPGGDDARLRAMGEV